RLLDEERAETGLTEEEVYEFTRQIDKQLIERNIENAGKTRLSSIHKAKEESSRYIKCLDRNLIELLPTNLPRVTKTQNPTHQHSNPTPSIAEIIGDEGEKKAFKLLANNKKIKWEKLVRNWQEIEGLQVDIYGETKEKQEIWKQQIIHQEKIAEDFNSAKPI
ncbi:10381_t:CDS:2, partial [Racocetra persica]